MSVDFARTHSVFSAAFRGNGNVVVIRCFAYRLIGRHCLPQSQRLLGLHQIRIRMLHALHVLVRLVSFACDQNHIGYRGLLHRTIDRARSMHFSAYLLVLRHARQNIAHDLIGVFGARIVRGHDDAIGNFLRNCAHLRPLARVAITTAAKHTGQLATTLMGNRQQRGQSFFQGIRCVRKIDHDQRLTVTTKTLHASRCCRNIGAIGHTFSDIQAQAHAHAQHAERIHDIELANQTRTNAMRHTIDIQGELGQCAGLIDLAGL